MDRKSEERTGTGTAPARGFKEFVQAVDKACARMNHGLAAIAIVLAVVVVVTAALKEPIVYPEQLDADAAAQADAQ